jgi:serine/threonine-protein kinase
VTVYSSGVAGDTLFLAMRYVQGTDLRAVLGERGPIDPETAVRIISQIAGALDSAHRAGMLHRDVKPDRLVAARRHRLLPLPGPELPPG